MAKSFVATLRTGVFAFVILASFILLALCAHVTHATTQLVGFYFPFAALGIATSLLAILTLPAMLILDNLRKGTVTSMILVEISWLGTLWILFLATAGNATQTAVLTNTICSLRKKFGSIEDLGFNDPTVCREYKAIQAFAHLAWLALFVYVFILSAFSIKLFNRGYTRVWYQSVKEIDFDAPPMSMPTQQYIPPPQTEAYYPPQAPTPGWAGTPQQVPAAQNLKA